MITTRENSLKVLLICMQLVWWISSYAQPDRDISFYFRNQPLKDALEFVISEYKVPIVYQDSQVAGIRVTA